MRLDPDELARLGRLWATVEKLSAQVHRVGAVGGLAGGTVVNETPLEEHFNLAFVLAFACLDEFLEAIGKRAGWKAGLRTKDRMEEWSKIGTWVSYDAVDAARERRNDLAHDAILQSKAQCLADVDAIRKELQAWRVI